MSSDEGENGSSLRRRAGSPAAAPPLEDDNLLCEILLRLPPQPSSLPRVSAVSRRWRNLAFDPGFSRRFRLHHRRSPPLLGCFVKDLSYIHFQPALEPPNRLPRGCFSFPIAAGERFLPLGCRHGLVLILLSGKQLLVWDPVSDDQHRLDFPPGFDMEIGLISAAVFRCAGEAHHFQVVLVGNCERQNTRAVASVYSSETGVWGNLISTQLPYDDSCELPTVVYVGMPAVMVGDSLYWLLTVNSEGILEFNLAKRCLAVIPMPVPDGDTGIGRIWVMLAEGGGLGFLSLKGFCAQSWKRMTDCDGVGSWVLQRSIGLDKLLSLDPETQRHHPEIIGFAEDNNVVLLYTSIGIFSVQLESLQFKKLFESSIYYRFYPFEGVYTAEGGGLGFLSLKGFCAQSWKRMTDCDAVGSWVLQRSIQLDKLLSLNPETDSTPIILGFAEDNNMVLLWTSRGVSSVQLESMQFKKLFESNIFYQYYPFEGVYTAEKAIDGGHEGAELLQNT